MGVKVANNATSTLAANITAAATSLAIQAGDAAKFPVLAAGDWFPMTIVDATGNMEVVRVTARNAATLTIARAQEGTTARAFSAGARCDLRLTSAALIAFINEFAATLGNVAKDDVVPVARGGLGTTSIAAARTALGLAAVALSGNIADLSGILPNARVSGAYDGITNLGMTGILTNKGNSEAIRLQASSAGGDPYITWYEADGTTRRAYIQHSDGTAATNGLYLYNQEGNNGICIRNVAGVDGLYYRVGSSNYVIYHNGNVLDIGTTAATARAALGLGQLAIENFSDLFYTGTANGNTNFPIGSYLFVWADGNAYARNANVPVRIASGSDTTSFNVGTGTSVSGTWRSRGTLRDLTMMIAQRVA